MLSVGASKGRVIKAGVAEAEWSLRRPRGGNSAVSVCAELSVAEPQWVMKHKISFYSVFPSSVQPVGLACGLRCTLPLTMLYLKVMAGTRLPLRQGVVPLAAVACHNKTSSAACCPPALWDAFIFSDSTFIRSLCFSKQPP